MEPCHCIVGRSSESVIEFGNHQLPGETFWKTVWICNFKQWRSINWRGCFDQNDTRWVIHETVHQIEVGCWITVYGLQHCTYQWYQWWDYSLASLWAERLYHQLANSLKIGIPYLYTYLYKVYLWQDVGFIPEPFLFAKSRDDILRQLSFTCPAGFLPSAIESWYQTQCADVSLKRHDLTF